MKLIAKLFVASVLLTASGCTTYNHYGELGAEAHKDGKYDVAEFMLKKGLESKSSTHAQTVKYSRELAETYWEHGKDHELLKLCDKYLSAEESHKWWCKVLSRRGHVMQAEECWAKSGEPSKALTLLKRRVLLESFAPLGSRFGYRPSE